MRKLLVFILLVLLAIIVSGLYGILHDQISYTVSPEYFSKFKFRQFGIADMNLPDRARASIVGFLATWWMGIPIGIVVGGIGFVHSDYQRMFKISLLAFGVVLVITLFFGLCGLLYGYFKTKNIDLANYQGWFIPKDVVDLRHFLCAGYMHNASYLGGTVSIFAAGIFQITVRLRQIAGDQSR